MSSPTVKALRDEIESALADAGLSKVDPDILSKCVGLATSLQLSPQKMAVCWETLSLNRKLQTLNATAFHSYRQALIKESDAVDRMEGSFAASTGVVGTVLGRKHALPSVTPPAKRSPHLPASGRNQSTHSSAIDAIATDRRVSLSPEPPRPRQPSTHLPKFSERTNAGKVVVTYNPGNRNPSAPSKVPRICNITHAFATNVDAPYRHMFTPLDERAKALDRQLVELGDAMVKQYGLGQEIPLEGVGVPRQEVICCIGRICNAAHEGRINATSVLLEGSRQVSGGARIELDLTALQNESKPFSLFPGQIVAVEGMNTSGRKLVAHKIYEGVANPVTKTPSKTLLRYYHDDAFQGGQPLRIMTVCGPYTSSDNLDYEPFLDLVNVINAERPDVAILTGPFVDTRHEAIRTGQTILKDVDNGTDIVVPYETLFAQKVAALLEDLFQEDEHFSTQFVLVPSLNDATAEWVIPQPPLKNNAATISDIQGSEGIEIGSLGLHHIENVNRTDQKMHRVHCVSNPCTLQINELVIGVSCTDTLFDISTDETNANLEPGSRLGRISQHMIHQQNYYPLFPPSMGVNLDWKKRSQWKMPCQPDVLIVPSKLACFAKTILSHTVVVNPGHLTRETTGGTYALMEVHPMLRDIVEDSGSSEVQLQHGAPSRTKVEIKRI